MSPPPNRLGLKRNHEVHKIRGIQIPGQNNPSWIQGLQIDRIRFRPWKKTFRILNTGSGSVFGTPDPDPSSEHQIRIRFRNTRSGSIFGTPDPDPSLEKLDPDPSSEYQIRICLRNTGSGSVFGTPDPDPTKKLRVGNEFKYFDNYHPPLTHV